MLAYGGNREFKPICYGRSDFRDAYWLFHLVLESGKGKQEIFISRIAQLSTYYCHNLLLEKDGTVWTWGYNRDGRLGLGTQSIMETPIKIPNLTDVVSVSAGCDHSLVLKKDGTVWAWGLNAYQCLPNHFDDDYLYRPQHYPELIDVKAIAAGSFIAACIKSDRRVYVWNFQCNEINWQTFPMEIPALQGAIQISSGGNHLIARKKDGSVWIWGENQFGLM